MNRRGFTLIELLVVISVIALIASIVLASLNTARTRGAMGAGFQFESNIYHASADQAVGIWDIDECSGSTVIDRSGSGNTGTLTNGATNTSTDTPTGRGCSAFFDASNDFILIPDSASMTFAGDVTLSAWIKPNVLSGNYRTFLAKRGTGTNYEMFLHTTTGALSWYNGTQYNSTYIPVINQWIHVAGVINGSVLTMYVNGALVYTSAVSPVTAFTGNPFYIGSLNGSEPYGGLVDSVRVYSKSLTAKEVGDLYAEGISEHYFALGK